MKTKLLWGVLFLALAASLAVYLLFPPPVANHSAPGDGGQEQAGPPVYGQVPEFQLTDQAGRPFASGSMKGRPWIADFIFTSCAGTCPQMTARMASLQGKLPPAVQLVSISVDPQRDTPQVLAEYAGRHGADPSRWRFLTGQPERIAPLVSQGFRLSYAEGTDPAEPIIHSIRFVLVDPAGAIRGYYDSSDPSQMERLVRDAVSLISAHPEPSTAHPDPVEG